MTVRTDRVIAMADWLDTIPPDPPFHLHPDFKAFRDLTHAELDAVQAEMKRRAQQARVEADALEAEGVRFSDALLNDHRAAMLMQEHLEGMAVANEGLAPGPILQALRDAAAMVRSLVCPREMDRAPKNGGWILGLVRTEIDDTYRQPWVILTWSDGAEVHDFGWYDDEGIRHEPTLWVPLPDPQPFPTGWEPPCGTIVVAEITGDGWTVNGKPIEMPYRWMGYIEKTDGSYDEYRETWHAVTLAEAQARAERWREKFGLPIVTVPLDKKVIPFQPPVTRQ